ncbi:MAG: hypothetical protein AB1938_21820, partial [Myxococcota bacterium]
MLTAFLSRADVSRHTQALTLLRDFREAFTARVHPSSVQTLQFDAPVPNGSTLVRQASLPGLPAYSITVRADFEDPATPARQVLQLHESTTGKLLALMDAEHLTSLRASLVSALAADVLARPEASNVAVLGTGAAASGALKALLGLIQFGGHLSKQVEVVHGAGKQTDAEDAADVHRRVQGERRR